MKSIDMKQKVVLVTGAAGFIGYYLTKSLLEKVGCSVVGVDNMNDYYDVRLKEIRLKGLQANENFSFIKGSISDKQELEKVFEKYKPEIVVNLAAQAGVRYSITNPDVYIEANLIGFFNILECSKKYKVEHLVYASSSSVYGMNKNIPYSVEDKVDHPVSLYAATKKSNELLAHSYSKLYQLPTTGLRFFTVYGPMGRPDMAYYKFADKLCAGDTIQIYNFGKCKRDFTYIDDIVQGIINVMEKSPEPNEDGVQYKIYNIGNNKPVELLDFIQILQEELVDAGVLPQDYNFEAHKELVPMQAGDVEITYADIQPLMDDFGFRPSTELRQGLKKFAQWYKEFNFSNEVK